MIIKVKVTPNSRKNLIKEFKDNTLYVKISKPPFNDKANLELIEFLQDVLNIKGIKILSGRKGREKILNIPIEEDDFKEKINNLLK